MERKTWVCLTLRQCAFLARIDNREHTAQSLLHCLVKQHRLILNSILETDGVYPKEVSVEGLLLGNMAVTDPRAWWNSCCWTCNCSLGCIISEKQNPVFSHVLQDKHKPTPYTGAHTAFSLSAVPTTPVSPLNASPMISHPCSSLNPSDHMRDHLLFLTFRETQRDFCTEVQYIQ